MTDHVYRNFPNDIELIRTILEKDTTFSEICADYDEMCTWLDNYCRSEGRSSKECYRAIEMIQDLEVDIKKVLRDRGFYPT